MAVFALILAAALLASEPDGVVATAPRTTIDLNATAEPLAPSTVGATQDAVAHGLSTDQQIDRWIAARSTADKPWQESARETLDERSTHGEVRVGIGTGGYRDYGVALSLPIGESGRLDLSYRQVENGYTYGGYGGPYDYFDDSGYGFPGCEPDAAIELEARAKGPIGSSRRCPLMQPRRNAAD